MGDLDSNLNGVMFSSHDLIESNFCLSLYISINHCHYSFDINGLFRSVC